MSANLLVDLNGTCSMQPSLQSGNSVSGQVCGLSGVYVGQSVDLINANTFCQVYIAGNPALSSGNLIIGVQVSDVDSSGQYVDPTIGLQTFPTVFQSGGNIWVNSGSTGGLYNSGAVSGQSFNSGFFVAGAFQRTARYARLIFNSGFYIGTLNAGFISQKKTTGSGPGGFSWQPQNSGQANVVNV